MARTDPETQGRHVARSPVDRVLRYIGLVIGIVLGWQVGARVADPNQPEYWGPLAILVAVVVGGIGFIIAPYITVRFVRWLRRKIAAVPPIDVVAAGIGLVVGGVLSSLLALPASLLPNPFGQIVPFVVAVIACVLSVFVLVLQKEELIAILLRRGAVREPEERLLLDTSVIIDGRIVELMRTGLVRFPLVVPRFVLRELQSIANSDDPSRRARGRRGLDALERLQREGRASVDVLDVEVDEESQVDNKLIQLARLSRYSILTGDQNLERVAKLQGVVAININSVAQALRPPVIPGEVLELDIVQPGRELGQGIGYLEDGTLIVVEEGRDRVGSHVKVIVTRTLQTGTGRMAFAQLRDEAPV
ncbi:MAG: twitching motility protein PilT [Chloroflexi bacterium]|nr:MAG: twitching motility protein PilT [Chloroflexota bacterium]